jgi:hypothetical protein
VSSWAALPPAHAAALVTTRHLPSITYGIGLWGDEPPLQIAANEKGACNILARHTYLPVAVVPAVTGLLLTKDRYVSEVVRLAVLACRADPASPMAVAARASLQACRPQAAAQGAQRKHRGWWYHQTALVLDELDKAIEWNDMEEACEQGRMPSRAHPAAVPPAQSRGGGEPALYWTNITRVSASPRLYEERYRGLHAYK